MRRPFTQLYVHLVWSTWDRLPLITPEMEPRLHAAMAVKCRELRVEPLAIGGMEDHVHLLVRLPTALAVAALVKEVKGSSSHLVTHEVTPGQFFKWQGGYGAFTRSREEAAAVTAYILHQREHHAHGDLWADEEQTEEIAEGAEEPEQE